MRLLLLLAWRHLAFRPGKTLASVLGIAVGMATVVSVLVVDHNTLETQAAQRTQGQAGASLVIQPDLRSALAFAEVKDDLLAQDLLDGVTAYATSKWSLQVDGAARSGLELFCVEAGAADHHQAYEVGEGDDLDFASETPQILLSETVARKAGVGPGDLVELALPAPRRRAPVARCLDGSWVVDQPAGAAAGGRGGRGGGRAEPARQPVRHPFRVVGLLAPTRLGFAGSRAVTTFAAGQELLGRNIQPLFWADFDTSRTDLPTIQRELGDRYAITSPRNSLVGLAPEERAFRSGVRFCGFLALFLGLYIIFNTMSMSLVERVRSIGLLRALGLTRGRLAGIFLAEGLALALLGAGLSLWLADRIVAVMVDQQITTLGQGKPLEITVMPWGEIGAVLVAGIVFCLLGVLYPFVRASRLSVIDALRRGVIELSADPFTGVRRSVLIGLLAVVPVAWIVGAPSGEYVAEPLYEAVLTGFAVVGGAFALLLLLPVVPQTLAAWLSLPLRGAPGRLARATLATARHRVFATVSGLMLVFTAIFLIVSVLESLKAETRGFGQRAMADRLYVKVSADGALRLPELRGAAAEFAGLVPLTGEARGAFVVRGVDSRLVTRGPLAEDPELLGAFVTSPSIVLSSRCADDLQKQPGDTVRLATAADGLVDFTVLAVSDAVGFVPDDRVFGVVSADTLLNLWCEDGEGLEGWACAETGPLSPQRRDELDALAAELLGEDLLELRRGEDLTAAYVADLDRNFAIFYAILLLTVLLAAVGILNAMVIAVMERRREIGLLRAVGLTGGQVAAMLLAESGALGALGGLAGLAVGLPLARVTAAALTEVSHLELSFALSGRALGAVLGGAVLVSVLAVLLPALRANRLNLSQVVRYE